ncbi:MAG: hypothetical protein M3X11_00350 [Acidobacteriota bacterium]|nr:hypothetical protein [Acidobacteriota bacterium]
MSYGKSLHVLLSGLCTMALLCNFVLQPLRTLAATAVQTGAQLTFARDVTINGSGAIAGQTVFNRSRIKVGIDGSAILNLGKLGRIELRGPAEFVLRISENTIGGELISGCATVNASDGVKVDINTPKGLITSDGKSPSSFVVGVLRARTILVSTLGTAKFATGGKLENVAAGEALTLISDANGGDRILRRSAAECGNPADFCTCSPTFPTRASNSGRGAGSAGGLLLPALLLAAAGATVAAVIGATGGSGGGLTCVGLFCRPISPTNP